MRQFEGRKSQPVGYHFWTTDYPEFQVICVQEGEVEMLVDRRSIPVHPGMMMVLRVGSTFSLSCPHTPYRGVTAGLRHGEGGRPVDKLDSDFHGPAIVIPTPPDVRQLADMMLAEMRRPGPRSAELLRSMGEMLLEFGARQKEDGRDPGLLSPEAWVERACQALRSGIRTNHHVEEVLSDIGLSYRQIARHFQTVLAVSPKEYQLRCRMDEAKRLLRGTRMSITDIAFELGYSSSQHFATQFRSRFSQSPMQYRRDE